MNEYINIINKNKKKVMEKQQKWGVTAGESRVWGGTELQSKAVKSEALKLKRAGKLHNTKQKPK